MSLPKISFTKENIYEHLKFSEDIKNKIIIEKNKFKPSSWQYMYLELIEEKTDDLLINEINDLQTIKSEFLNIKDLSKIKCKIKRKNCRCNDCKNNEILVLFSKKVQNIFGYSHDKMRNYFLSNGIKTCYICNAQYTIVAQKDYRKNTKNNHKNKTYSNSYKFQLQNENSLKFQLDHFLPKSIFPGFSLSLGNLYPICSYCNGKKSNKVIDLSSLFSNITYKLDVSSIQKYFSGTGKFELDISDSTSNIENQKLSTIFDLKGIYDNHLDVIEEIFERKIKYTNSYTTILSNAFPNIVGTSKNIEDRLILGTYSKSNGYYKRPLSKFIHDINDQLDSL